jgi:hypothetical protein
VDVVPWTFHKVHHSITTMDWIGNWRFHWIEIVVYKSLQWLPLAWLNASPEAICGQGPGLLLASGGERYDGHAGHTHRGPDQIPPVRPDAVDKPEPEEGGGHVDATIRGVRPAGRKGMECQKPGERPQTERSGNEEPWDLSAPQPKIGEVAAGDLGRSRQTEEEECLQ